MTISASARAALKLLNKRDRLKLGALVMLQIVLSFLDLIAVALIGMVALMAADAEQGTIEIPALLQPILSGVGLDSYSALVVGSWLAALAGVLMITKSILSFLVMRKVFGFLARRQAIISGRLASELLTRPLLDVQRRSSQDISYALTNGVNALTLGVLGQGASMISELSLLVVLGVGLLFFDPMVTIFTIAFFGLVAFGLHRLISGWASRLGKRSSRAQIDSMQSVQELMRTYREVAVSGRRGVYVEQFKGLRWEYSSIQSSVQVVNQVSKYVFEIALIIGGALLATSQFITKDMTAAIAVIAIFLAAASRIMPALLRLQSAALAIKTQSGVAAPALTLIEQLEASTSGNAGVPELSPEVRARLIEGLKGDFQGFSGDVECQNVSMTYPGAPGPAISDVTLKIPAASSLAIVGSTGSGKSTLADILLGVLEPDIGEVRVAGMSPREAILRWPGAVSYVAQDAAAINGNVRSNVALGLPSELVEDDRVWDALERAHLASFLSEHRDGLETIVGEHGIQLSGGQRQRLGIARALYTNPKLLVLDEATSALDAETEEAIGSTLRSLSGDVTLVIVAHRLATIRDVDQVAYLRNGVLEAIGTFQEVRAAASDFDHQAQLLGL